MALISKIRKNFWLLLLVIGFALASFILMDASGPGGGGSQGDTTMGMINGKKIDYMDYQLAESTYYQGGQGETFSKRQSIWNYFVEKTLLSDFSNKLGLAVGAEEMENLQFGAAPSPIIQQNWGQNPQALSQYKAMLDDGTIGNPENKGIADFWKQQSQQIGKAKIQEKISNLVSKAIYTPSWMATSSYKDDNTKVDFQYVKIPFDAITTAVALTDADFQSFIDENPSRFNEKVETRNIEYAVFNVLPTAKDSADILTKVNANKAEFASTQSDSLFAITKGGVYNPVYYKTENLLESMKTPITTMQPGEIYGPYVDNNAYILFKMIDARNVADTVKAQQILINADPNNAIQVTNANNKIDSLERLFKRGISFDSLAIKNSQDGSAFNGGDMGVLTQLGVYQTNPPLARAIFYGAKEGDLLKVKSPQGIHLVKVNDMTYSDSEPEYKVAMITEPIVPSQETQNAMSDVVSELILGNRDMESMRTAAAAQGASFQSSAPVKENDFALDALGAGNTSREIIKWAFDEVRETGDISGNVHTYTDPVNYYDSKYVIASLKSINPKGKQSVESLRSALQPEVMNMKKAQAFVSSLGAVSSLDDLAAQHSSTVETASNASLGSPFIPGLGNEPDVTSVAYATAEQTVSKPIIGKSGVYVVKPISKSEAGDVVNLPSIKSSLSSSMRSQVGFKLMESLKNGAKVEDSRSKFF